MLRGIPVSSTEIKSMQHKVDPYWERPCADHGLKSYRYYGRYGWIMIGAHDDVNAEREAKRSLSVPASFDAVHLSVWDGKQYVPVNQNPVTPPCVCVSCDKKRRLKSSKAVMFS